MLIEPLEWCSTRFIGVLAGQWYTALSFALFQREKPYFCWLQRWFKCIFAFSYSWVPCCGETGLGLLVYPLTPAASRIEDCRYRVGCCHRYTCVRLRCLRILSLTYMVVIRLLVLPCRLSPSINPFKANDRTYQSHLESRDNWPIPLCWHPVAAVQAEWSWVNSVAQIPCM